MIIQDSIRDEFEILKDSEVIYFDNSATTQRPKRVLNAIDNYYKEYCANAGRGAYSWSNKVSKKVEATRKKVANFINCDKEEVFFTSGATHSSNMICYSYALANLKDGDEVMLCYTDHKSTVLPWINIKEVLAMFGVNIVIKEIFADAEGDYNEDLIIDTISEKTKIVVLTHIHNVYGIENNIEFITSQVKEKNQNTLIALDATQSVGHIKVDTKELLADFLYFSGHKMFAGNGVGVLYIKKDLQKLCRPFMVGGSFNKEEPIKTELTALERNSNFFECGTLNFPEIISLGEAIDFINELDINEISIRLFELTRYLYDKLKQIKEIEFDKGIDKCSCQIGYGIISFRVEGILSSELGDILSDNNIFVRAGRHCSTTFTEETLRVSLQIYNTQNEIDIFVDTLKEIIEQLKNDY
ncbi:MAG: aminotransferase class V-fold PLP-dependent enzyme [Clostridia bacterium]|nr:aminotransferase class V-fold PLP-dependent enzyme [Clostridia bacterium]